MSQQLLTVGRDPTQEPRTLRFMQLVASVINSLARTPDNVAAGSLGVLHHEGPNAFGMAGLLFHGVGPPPESEAFLGDYYLDVTNGVLYRKVS
jgi:hypothetical protein